jgi:threonine/homoserine/homoserine lactone efflux protein
MQELLGPLVLFAAAVTLTPGPNVVLVTASAANFGFRRTIPQMLGITFGFGSMVLATGLGLAGVVHAEPRLHLLLKYAGAAYLLYLAWRIARADAAGAAARARPIGFVEATLFTWMNPKAWVSALGAAAAFTTVGGNVVWESGLIAAVLAAFCLLSAAVWAGFGTVIGRYLANPRARVAFNWSMAGLLVLSLIPVLW